MVAFVVTELILEDLKVNPNMLESFDFGLKINFWKFFKHALNDLHFPFW